MAPINVDISHLTTHVDNQKAEGSCYAFAVADMVSTSYRIKNRENIHESTVVLSPQPLIDMDIKNEAFRMLTPSNLGLQTIEDYPVTRSATLDGIPQYSTLAPRYIATGCDYVADENILKWNFGEHGPGYPIVAGLQMGGLMNSVYAKQHYDAHYPYKHEDYYIENLNKQLFHAVLIVAYNEAKRSCIIKNTWGVDWGHQGLSKVSCDTFVSFDVVYDVVKIPPTN